MLGFSLPLSFPLALSPLPASPALPLLSSPLFPFPFITPLQFSPVPLMNKVDKRVVNATHITTTKTWFSSNLLQPN